MATLFRARRRALLLLSPVLLLVGAAEPASAAGLCTQSICTDYVQTNGSIHRICVPEDGCGNGDLVLFAHGYVAPGGEPAIPEDQLALPDGHTLPEIVNTLGFGFATSSYPRNGLAIQEGVEDMVALVETYAAEAEPPGRIYLAGASEGGAVAALAVERHPEVFSGALATCGPVGSFQRQVNYWGDFRVVFDYFFPGVIPGSAVWVPDGVMDDWSTVYVPAVQNALLARPSATDQLLAVTRAPYDPANPATKVETVLGILWYNVFATNDGIHELGGQPFDNRLRWYRGSANDLRLNLKVKRYSADPSAALEIAANYETSGRLGVPVVTLHTTGDPIVPYGHEPLYSLKTWLSGAGLLHANLPVARYGHCRFETSEVLTGFGLLVLEVRGREPNGLRELLSAPR